MMVVISIILIVLAVILFIIWLRQKKGERSLLIVLVVVLAIAGTAGVIVNLGGISFQQSAETKSNSPTQSAAEPDPDNNKAATEAAKEELGNTDGGFDTENDIKTNEEVDVSQDTSTGGSGSFSEPIHTVAEMVSFLQSGTPAANACVSAILTATGGQETEVYNPSNWVRIQSLVSFAYPSNTGYNGTTIYSSGTLLGNKGDIFFAFVSPSSGAVVFVRGGCGNIQLSTPRPRPISTSTVSTSTTSGDASSTPKNPADSVAPVQGATQMSAGSQTGYDQSAAQESSGQTGGNVIDNPVDSGTTSGSTTSDTGNSVQVGGSTPSTGGSNAVTDSSANNYNNGGTSGDTHISDPG